MTARRSIMPDREHRDHLLDTLIARLPDDQRNVLGVLNAVNDIYIEGGRDKIIRKVFDTYLVYSLASQRHGRRGKGQAFYVTGASGSGKTHAIEHLFAEHPVLQPVMTDFGPVKPYASVSLEGPATLANLGNAILEAAGYPVGNKISRGDVWPMLPAELARLNVFLVHIDEAQHLIANESERENVPDYLKGLINDPKWPLRLVLTGRPKVNDIILNDDQSERRNFSVELPALALPENREMVTEAIEKLCAAAGLAHEELIATDMPERIAHAANYQFGRIVEVITAGIQSAIAKSETNPAHGALTRKDFARAYLMHSSARGRDEMNPFIADDWFNLKPGYFILREDDTNDD